MKKYRQYLALIIILSYLLFLVGCGASQGLTEEAVNINSMGNEVVITDFYYSRFVGGQGHAFRLGIDQDDDLIINYLNYGLGGSNDVHIPFTQEKYNELVKIIEDYDLESWNGWGQEKEDIIIEDGGGFTLEIQWSDGTIIIAEDDVPYPENFSEADKAIGGFFKFYFKDWEKANNIK